MAVEQDGWTLSEWREQGQKMLPMTEEEIENAVAYLRSKNYPKPKDCPESNCKEYRPACTLGVCKIAVMLTGDW